MNPGRVLAVVAALGLLGGGAAALWRLSSNGSAPPSPADRGAWTWISSVPGANVYVHEVLAASSPQVWVDFKSERSPASIDADFVELWEFDCATGHGRRTAGPIRFQDSKSELPRSQAPEWRAVSRETVLGKMMTQVCPSSISRHPKP
jgi:hypothetical protein